MQSAYLCAILHVKHKRITISRGKGQCPDYAHARASSVFSPKDNRTVILTRQDFLPDRTADRGFVVHILK